MTPFLLLSALLALVAIAFATSSLWRGQRRLAIVLALVIPALSGLLYGLKGEPAALDPANVVAPETMDEAIVQLQRHLAREPDNFQGWLLLGRSQMAAQRFDRARDAYQRAFRLQSADNDVAVEYSEALLRSSRDRRFPPAAVQMLQDVLTRQPDNQRALFFLGLHMMQESRPRDAADAWQRLLPLLSPDAASALRPQVDQARLAAGLPSLPDQPDIGAPGMDVEVRIDPALADSLKPGSTLYVFARKPDGSGAPFAVKRLVLDAFPVRVRLTDADSPMPTARLSTQASVELMARLSLTGAAQPGAGDLEAAPAHAAVADGKPHVLTLSRVVE